MPESRTAKLRLKLLAGRCCHGQRLVGNTDFLIYNTHNTSNQNYRQEKRIGRSVLNLTTHPPPHRQAKYLRSGANVAYG